MGALDAEVDDLEQDRLLFAVGEDGQAVAGHGAVVARPLDRIGEGAVTRRPEGLAFPVQVPPVSLSLHQR